MYLKCIVSVYSCVESPIRRVGCCSYVTAAVQEEVQAGLAGTPLAV